MARSAFAALILALGLSQADASAFFQDLSDQALKRTEFTVVYDGAYVAIDYPNGDVPANRGVCTDVVIRSYRALGFDLQQAVHEDMSKAFGAYPAKRIWGQNKPDSNIDHRRVPNLQTYFQRHGHALSISTNADDYRPGDLVTWMLPGNLPHIGIVVERYSRQGLPMVVHNIRRGPQLEDILFSYPITGHYRFKPAGN